MEHKGNWKISTQCDLYHSGGTYRVYIGEPKLGI